MTPAQLTAEIERTLEANGMTDGAHLRLMVTRGEKAAANQDPRNWLGKPTIVITAEYKEPSPGDRHPRPVAGHLVDPLHPGRDVRHAAELAQPAEPDPRPAGGHRRRAPTRR